MKLVLFIIVSFNFLNFSTAAEVGEIINISKKGVIKFYIDQIDVKTGEMLGVLNSKGDVNFKIKVTSVKSPYAEAMVVSVKPTYMSGFVERIMKGQRVRLTININELRYLSFFVGPTFSNKVGGFGGTSYSMGLDVGAYINPEWLWSVRIQADDLGEDSAGIGKRKAYYLIGAGYEYSGVRTFYILEALII